MKIYFAGSIRGGRDDAKLYQQIIEFLMNYGEVLTEHVGNMNLTVVGEDGPNDEFIHDRDMQWLLSADVVVAEVTTPSLGVGYEIGRAVENKIPVLCIYYQGNSGRLSAMISGSSQIQVKLYKNLDEAKKGITEFMAEL